jgi:hypothetical protein
MEIRNTKKIVWSALPHPLLKYKVSDICVTIYALYDHAWCHRVISVDSCSKQTDKYRLSLIP